jgi:hypothetical protein
MGKNGSFTFDVFVGRGAANTDGAQVKAKWGSLGAIGLLQNSAGSNLTLGNFHRVIRNLGATNVNVVFPPSQTAASDSILSTVVPSFGTIDTTSSQTLTFTEEMAATSPSTDFVIIYGGTVTMHYAP